MADNVIVRVPEQQIIKGEDGKDGASAYEQAVAGGYTGTEAQFNEELASFKELSEQAADSAAASAQSESNAAGSAMTATTKAQEAADSAAQALIRMNSADASAQAAAGSAGDASTAATTATTKAGEASDSATAADDSAKDSEAYAVGKRGGTDVGSTDPAYHNNSKYYAEQASGIVDDVEQATTSTTVGPVPLAIFDASAADMPLKSLTVNIEPVQSGTGDPSPDNVRPITGWTGAKVMRTGKNLLPNDGPGLNNSSGAATFVKNSDGTVSVSDQATTANRYYRYGSIELLPGTYTLSGCPSGGTQDTYFIALRTGSYGGTLWSRDVGRGYTFTISSAKTVYITLYAQPSAGTVNLMFKPMIRLATVTDADYEPYQGNIYSITFPSEAGTVYGGTLDVVNRKLNSYPYYSSYNGETIIGPWISSMDVYTPGATPTLGAQVVDMGGAATSYDLSDAPEITTFLGTNNIWANRGDVTVTYGAYLEIVKAYADKVGDSILNAIAPLETSYTASRNYAIGSFLFVGTKFYKVTAAISSGDTITPDTNVTQTTVAEQLMALANV